MNYNTLTEAQNKDRIVNTAFHKLKLPCKIGYILNTVKSLLRIITKNEGGERTTIT